MNNKEKEVAFDLIPLEKGMTFDETCWVAVNTRSDETTEVIFFNSNQKEGTNCEDLEKFEEFCEYVFEDYFFLDSRDAEVQTDISPVKGTKSGCVVKEVEDFDEDSNKCWTELIAEAQIIDVYKNKTLDEIKQLVQVASKDLDNLESNSKSDMSETISYQNDPYAYYGVSRNDF